MKFIFLAVLFHLFNVILAADFYELLDDLFKNYNKKYRPIRNRRKTVEVEIVPLLINLLEVDDRIGYVEFIQWLRMYWIDEYMQWYPYNYSGITEIKIPLDDIWFPDVTVWNSIPDIKQLVKQERLMAKVNFKGRISSSIPMMLKEKCRDFELEPFPFDTQNCSTKYASWTYSDDELQLRPKDTDEVSVSKFEEHSEWKVLSFRHGIIQANYTWTDKSERYTEVYYHLVIKRRPRYYMHTMIIPTFIITTTCILGLFIPSSSTNERVERISIGLTTMLAMAIMLNIVAGEMPKSPNLSSLGKYMLQEIIIVCVATLATAIVMHFHRRAISQGWRVPMWLMKLMCVKRHDLYTVQDTKEETSDNPLSEEESEKPDRLTPTLEKIRRIVMVFIRYLQDMQRGQEKELGWSRVFNAVDFAFLLIFLVINFIITGALVVRFETFDVLRNIDTAVAGFVKSGFNMTFDMGD